MILTIILTLLFAVSTVSAEENTTSDVISAYETTDDVISDNGGIDNAVIVEDNSTVEADFDLLGGEGYEIVNNTVYFNLTDLNAFYKSDSYYIFDYSDGKNTKELSSKYNNTYSYCYNLNLTNNSDYNYTFYGHPYISGNHNAQPWSLGQYSSSNLVLQGSFKTDDYGNIVDFTHNQHLKLVLSNYNNTCTVISMSKPSLLQFDLNGKDAALSIGKKLIIGINVIEPTYFSKKVFNVVVHGKNVEEEVPEAPNTIDITLNYDDVTVEIDVLENAIRTDKNTIYIDNSKVAKDWSYQEYYFDYNDNYAKSAKSDCYNFSLALSPNTKYKYEFLGRSLVAGYDYYRPWEWNSGYQSKVMFNGTFETDENAYICNFTHNQHYKFVFKINGQIDFYGGDVKSYDLNNDFIYIKEGRLLKGSNSITLTVLNVDYNLNVFRPYTMYNGDTPLGSFSDLKDRMSTGLTEFIFDCDYIYNPNTDSNFQNGIKIETYKTISIDGNGHVIDGNGQSKVFRINSHVILKNITFTNFVLSTSSDYGVIYWSGTSGTLENCNFTNISVNKGYGAIRLASTNLKINNCYFDCNYAKDSLFYLYGGSIIISNCTFNNNTNVISIGSSVKTSEISNCLFINNNGSTIKHSGVEGMITNCTFINNSNNGGGAISISGKGNVLFNSLFINNTASDRGGAISWSGAEGIMNNCTFINNSASNSSGAVSWTGEYGTIDNCIFINNTPISSFSDTSRVFKRQLTLNSSNYVFNYKHIGQISIIINNIANNLQVEAPIIFKLNNGIKTKNISSYAVNDVVCLFDEMSDLDVGNWTVAAIFDGDDNYYPCNATFMVTVNPTVSFLTFDKINATYGEQTILTVNVSDYLNLKISEGSVVFFEDDVQIGESIVTNGIATLNYIPSAAGEHFIIAVYRANNYVNNTNSTQFYVNKANPIITIDLGEAIEDSDLIVDVDIAGATGNVFINNEEFILINNKASKTIPKLVVGELPIEVVYFGDNNYLNSTELTKITVKPKQNPYLHATVKNIDVGQTAIIDIVINEKVTGKVTINENEIQINSGKGNYNIKGLSEGNYTYIIKFEGDKYFNESNVSVSLKVSKVVVPADRNPFIPTKTTDGTQLYNPSYTLSLGSDATGNLTISIGDKTFIKELVNGTATIEVVGLPEGDYIAIITYSGDSKYAPITRTVNATVKANPATNVKISTKIYYSNTKQYTVLNAIIKDGNGKPIKEGKVQFKINGKTYNVNVKNGVATKKIKLTKAKTYTYAATYLENDYYKKSQTSKNKVYVYSSSKNARTFKVKGYKFTLTQNQYNKLINAKNTGKTLFYKVKTNKKIIQTVQKISYSYKWKYVKTVDLVYAHEKCYYNSNYRYDTVKTHWISDGEYYKTCKLYKKVEVEKVSYKTVNSIVYAWFGYALNGQAGHDKYWIEIMTDNSGVVKGKLHWEVKSSTLSGLKTAKPKDMKNFSMR